MLFDSSTAPSFDLPEALGRAYGALGIAPGTVFANFVSSIDGAVALPWMEKSSPAISAGDRADRFLLALLRGVADAVVIGAGTYRAHKGPWIARSVFPELADEFAALRDRAGAAPDPAFVVVTRSGDLGEPRRILAGALVVAPAAAEARLERYREAGAEIVVAGEDHDVDTGAVRKLLEARGYSRVLTEGGPELMGRFLEAGAVDELFLTISPLVFGGGEPPPATIGGSVSFREQPVRVERLLSVRRAGDYLFLRYSLRSEEPGTG